MLNRSPVFISIPCFPWSTRKKKPVDKRHYTSIPLQEWHWYCCHCAGFFMLSETSGSYHKAALNLLGLRSALLSVFCVFVANVADVIAFVSSVNMKVDLPSPPRCHPSVTPNQRRINTPKIFLLLTNHSGLSEKHWESHKSISGMDLLCSNRKYTVGHRSVSHTWKKNGKECMHWALWRGSDSRGGINGHYSLPRCIRFPSHQFVQMLSLTNWTKTFAEEHAAAI